MNSQRPPLVLSSALLPDALTASAPAAGPAIALHPDNPHYFLWRGRPTVLITSGEHCGTVLNLDFDNVDYEICNELYFGRVTVEWQPHIAARIMETRQGHPHPKLIPRNVANGAARVTDPHPARPWPPDAHPPRWRGHPHRARIHRGPRPADHALTRPHPPP